ncbi:hypothetical protein V1523DRAFT_439459 [Lipomyces doorenjongii]
MQQSAPIQSHSRSQSTPGSGTSPPVMPSLGPGSQSRTLPPFRPGRELPPPLHQRAPSGGISISSILGASSPPPLSQQTLQSTQQPASAPVSATRSVVSAGSTAAGRSPSPQHQPQHQHVHRHHHHHHHHHLVSPTLPPEISHDADQQQQEPQQQQLQPPQRSRTSLSPETQFATASPQQQQQQQQQPPASTTPTPSEQDHRPRMNAASPFTVGPTLPPVQFDPSSTPRRTAPSTPQAQHAALVEQQLHPAQPPSTLPHPQSSQNLQQVGQQSEAAPPQESTPVRAEDAVARVVKKAAAAAASTVSFSADQSIADSASCGSTNSSVIGSPTLDGDKSRKRRHHHRNHSHLFESGLGGLKTSSASPPPPPPASTYDMPTRYQLRVDSTDVVKAANAFPSYNLGSLVYTPTPDSHQPIIPRLEDKVNSLIQIRIARRFLSRRTNPHVTRREVWGTDVYTDDSDVVAAIYHCGYLAESPDGSNGEKGDCVATLRILPLLQKYQGTFRHGINSRSWLTRHDGVSYRIEKVDFIRPGKAEDRGWKMKKRRLEEWRVSKEWREERYGGENLKDDFEMDVDK